MDRLGAACGGQIPTTDEEFTLAPPLDFEGLRLLVSVCLLANYWRALAETDGLTDMADYDRLIADGLAPDKAYSAAPFQRGAGPVGVLGG